MGCFGTPEMERVNIGRPPGDTLGASPMPAGPPGLFVGGILAGLLMVPKALCGERPRGGVEGVSGASEAKRLGSVGALLNTARLGGAAVGCGGTCC
jgi:hypothetical protein